MISQANRRANEPVGSYQLAIQELQKQIQLYRAELDLVLMKLAQIHSRRNAARVDEPILNLVNPDTYVAGAQSTHIPFKPNPNDFSGYADWYIGYVCTNFYRLTNCCIE